MERVIRLDIPRPYGFRLQDASSKIMEEITSLNDSIVYYMILIIVLVSYILYRVIKSDYEFSNKYLLHNKWLEIIWTILPGLILILIAIPSFTILYLMEKNKDSLLTVKVIGYQWYWKYEYSDYEDKEFESYYIPEDLLEFGGLRLLDTDTSLVIPKDVWTRILVTSNDVIHNFAVPSLGIKIDSIPGRLNQVNILSNRIGVYYGQCNELCGVNHGLMPIKIEVKSIDDFIRDINEI